MKDWLKGLLSLEERKASTLMLSLIAFSATGVYILLKTQNIPMELVYLILGIGGLVTGINVIPGMFPSNNMNGGYNSYNSCGNYGATNMNPMMNSILNGTPSTNTSTDSTQNPV